MSVVYKGEILDSDLTKNANGGTEQMRTRLMRNVDSSLLEKVAIHFSRPEELFEDVPNILYFHDLADDPAVDKLKDRVYHEQFDLFVFVSYTQRNEFINKFQLPYSKCVVIQNAIETEYEYREKPKDKINLIYHTTPHRGLELVIPIFNKLCEMHDNLHLDVFSSFGIYGWEQRDAPYGAIFNVIKDHPNMTYHGYKSNKEVLSYLKDAHIFLYPSIWKETSCIALIEAMASGVFSIYPSLGALPETGSLVSNIGMYEFTEDFNTNATYALNMANGVIENIKNNPHFVETILQKATSQFSPHTITKYKKDWESVITLAIERKQNVG